MKSANDLEQLLAMLVSDDDLRKLDDAQLKGLSHEQLLELSRQVVRDLKDARDRLNQNPDNSSRPPSTQVPWAGLGLTEGRRTAERHWTRPRTRRPKAAKPPGQSAAAVLGRSVLGSGAGPASSAEHRAMGASSRWRSQAL
jgi:hypothetical protein